MKPESIAAADAAPRGQRPASWVRTPAEEAGQVQPAVIPVTSRPAITTRRRWRDGQGGCALGGGTVVTTATYLPEDRSFHTDEGSEGRSLECASSPRAGIHDPFSGSGTVR